MIDAELYRIFYTVGSCATISAAAEKLFVSQPAVSKSIKKLEELTGCILFVRSSRGVRLTTEGRILFNYVREAFGHLSNGERVLERMRNKQEGRVTVGISTTLCRYFFMPYLEMFHKRYPGIRIVIVNRTSADTLKTLAGGVIDFGIISIPADKTGLCCHDLLSIEDIFVARKGYGDFGNSVSYGELKEHPLMMLEQGNVTRMYVDSILAAHGVVLQPEIEIGSMEFLVEFARIGLGIAAVIGNFVEPELDRGTLVRVPVAPAFPTRKVGLVMTENLPLSWAARTCISFLKEHTQKGRL